MLISFKRDASLISILLQILQLKLQNPSEQNIYIIGFIELRLQ